MCLRAQLPLVEASQNLTAGADRDGGILQLRAKLLLQRALRCGEGLSLQRNVRDRDTGEHPFIDMVCVNTQTYRAADGEDKNGDEKS